MDLSRTFPVLLGSFLLLGFVACSCGSEGEGEGEGSVTEGEGEGGNAEGEGEGEIDTSGEIYDEDTIPHFAIDLPPASLAALEIDPREYVTGTFTYGDEVVENVGVRLRGDGTFRPIGQKASFRIKFDAFVVDQRFHGLKRMAFHSMLRDPSAVAERLAYFAFRGAGLPAPRANHATVTINGEDHGLYLNLEVEDKTFVRRNFDDNDGNLYQEDNLEWVPGNESSFELETNETENDRSDLTALFAAISTAADETLLHDIGDVLDVDAFFAHCAFEGLVNQWDGYAYSSSSPDNYRLYHEPTLDLFYLIPWGMELAFKPYNLVDNVDLAAPTGDLLERCAAIPACQAEYFAAVADAIGVFEDLDLRAEAEAIQALIDTARLADPLAETTDEDYQAAYNDVLSWIDARPAAARAAIGL